jgi:phospholipid/cholesterol/gamma-HCH transport system substrate-binding protein
MKALVKEHGAEVVIGLLVVLIAIWFVAFAWGRTGGGNASNPIRVTAQFQNAVGVDVGTDVRIAGLKVGQVVAQKLDPKSYMAELTLALDPSTNVPSDSSAAITSAGIMGANYISLVPGGDPTPLKNGDTILDTQGSVDLMSMVGQFINKTGGGGTAPAGDKSATPAPASAPAAATPTP